MTRSYVIWPLRFTPRPAAMIDFYTRIGLQPALTHENGTFASFTGRSGALGVHDAADTANGSVREHTALNVATADLMAAAEELQAAGLKVRVWDETYGQQGIVVARDGRIIGLNEAVQEDLYGGYLAHQTSDVSPFDIVAIADSGAIQEDVSYFAEFGFTTTTYDPWWVGLRTAEHGGVVGLRAGESGQQPFVRSEPVGPPYEVRIGFETSEALDDLAQRLKDEGLQPRLIIDDGPARVELTDPDGEQVDIHQSPNSVPHSAT